MIRAMIFDLDGTLVQTERLKALSYAQAVMELCPREVSEDAVLEAFKAVVGLPRQEVATKLVEQFQLEEASRARMAEFGVGRPWQAFVQVRLEYYEKLIADPDTLRQNQWPHNMELLRAARAADCEVGLATMSHCERVQHVLSVLGLEAAFDFVATRDDVEHGKPDPEIYELIARELGVGPGECLVIEDSPAGVQAALAAGMEVIAVSTPFTADRLRESGLLPEHLIVHDPNQLPQVAARFVDLSRKKAQRAQGPR